MHYEKLNKGWIGFDLDGTLAVDLPIRKSQIEIGPPIPKMVDKVRMYIAAGRAVRLFTARAFQMTGEEERAITEWLIEHVGVALPITCMKDGDLLYFYDDKAIQVIANRGETVI